MIAKRIFRYLPDWKNALLALLSAGLLILAFPDFDLWILAWFALVPFLWAINRQQHCVAACFFLGWLFGTAFFFGTCWWLTYAPITYAGFPPILAYSLFFCVAAVAGLFPAIFAGVLSLLLRRFGYVAMLAAPFVWVFTEFLRYWVTGNNWNAIGYSQAWNEAMLKWAGFGGIWVVSGIVASLNIFYGLVICGMVRIYAKGVKGAFSNISAIHRGELPGMIDAGGGLSPTAARNLCLAWMGSVVIGFLYPFIVPQTVVPTKPDESTSTIIGIQPNVPMTGLTNEKWSMLRERHVGLAETALATIKADQDNSPERPTLVVFPESPMNFAYDDDPELQRFVRGFTTRNNVSLLFNSAEPDKANGKYFNSAVMVDQQGNEVAQYDKIHLLPFGEAVPFPLEGLLPGFVGNFSYGSEYDLLPVGDAKAGVMICFESHFGQLSREYVRDGADVIIEMTNDGYLGPTPVLRQHLANAVFRAVETNRPVLRVTNVGVTAYISERGNILDSAPVYQEDTQIWSVSKSDGSQTFYVRYGDWFAWLCSIGTILLLGFAALRPRDAQARP